MSSSEKENLKPDDLRRVPASHNELFRDLERLADQVSSGNDVDESGLAALVILHEINSDDPRVSKLMYICQSDVVLSKRMDAISRRMQHIMTAKPPSVNHFSRLRAGLPRRDRNPAKPQRTWLIRSVVGIAGVLIVFLGVTYLTSEMQPEYQKLAALQTVRATVPELHFRSTDTTPDELHSYYQAGIQAFMDADRPVLGLFHRFDAERLNVAQELLNEVTILDPDGAVGLEAAYILARIHLHKGDIDTARNLLTHVIEQHGPSEPEATELIRSLG